MIDPATSEPPRKNVQLPLVEIGVTKPSHTSTPAVEASDPLTVVCEAVEGMRSLIANV